MPFDNSREEDLGVAAGAGPFAKLLPDAPATAAELMATPDHMLAWLRSKRPDEVVVRDMYDNCGCLGATFLRQRGFDKAHWGTDYGFTGKAPHRQIDACPAVRDAIKNLYERPTNITALRAAEVLDHAIAARRAGLAP